MGLTDHRVAELVLVNWEPICDLICSEREKPFKSTHKAHPGFDLRYSKRLPLLVDTKCTSAIIIFGSKSAWFSSGGIAFPVVMVLLLL